MRAASVRLATWLTLGFCSLAAGPVLAQQVCKYESIVATAPASRFTDNGNGTVTDTATGLQWKRCSEGQTWNGTTCTGTATTHTWRQALNRANTASYAGKSDWRLPNVKELASIVEQACHNLAIDLAVFPASPGPWYWSSSPNAYYADFAWCVDFRSGYDGNYYKSYYSHVRLVRGGQALGSVGLNDTGLDWWASADTNFLSAPPAGYPGQDASLGRDARQDDDTDGHAGFSFTKLDAGGNGLPASATSWSCVRDNVTGLVWEVKTDDGGLRDREWRYTWYNPDAITNGGSSGTADGTNNCFEPARCDTHKYAADVNAAGLCGASDWRLPSREELRSLVDYSRDFPAIDTGHFPRTESSYYWSSSPLAYRTDYASYVSFDYGDDGSYYKSHYSHVRLVRGGRALLSSDNADFNLDGKTDVLWRNTVSGANRIWMMNGISRTSVVKLPALTDISWHVVGTGDFNADGKVDILWRNKATGANRVWLMNRTTRASVATLPADANVNWDIVGTGDFNGDGKVDILWRNKATGTNRVWRMNGTKLAFINSLPADANVNWDIVGTGDFNRDGKVDILWRNSSTGANRVWRMNGTSRAAVVTLPAEANLDWQIVGTGDFNADGKVDIVWRNKVTGANRVWRMNGTKRASVAALPADANLNWEIVGG